MNEGLRQNPEEVGEETESKPKRIQDMSREDITKLGESMTGDQVRRAVEFASKAVEGSKTWPVDAGDRHDPVSKRTVDRPSKVLKSAQDYLEQGDLPNAFYASWQAVGRAEQTPHYIGTGGDMSSPSHLLVAERHRMNLSESQLLDEIEAPDSVIRVYPEEEQQSEK